MTPFSTRAIAKRARELDRLGDSRNVTRFAAVGRDGLVMANGNAVDSIDREGRSVLACISTEDIDADGDLVVSRGCRTERFAKSGAPVGWDHFSSYPFPVGSSRSPTGELCVYVQPKKVLARWFPDPHDEVADFLWSKIQASIVGGASVGFIPIDAEPRQKADRQRFGNTGQSFTFNTWSLTEWSWVVTPSNENAVRVREIISREGKSLPPLVVKSLSRFAAVPRGRCFSGYCPPVRKATTGDLVSAIRRADSSGFNLVHLEDVRAALGIDRASLVKLVQQARRENKISLSDAEGRNRLTQRDREAIISEGNSQLLYVSLRKAIEPASFADLTAAIEGKAMAPLERKAAAFLKAAQQAAGADEIEQLLLKVLTSLDRARDALDGHTYGADEAIDPHVQDLNERTQALAQRVASMVGSRRNGQPIEKYEEHCSACSKEGNEVEKALEIELARFREFLAEQGETREFSDEELAAALDALDGPAEEEAEPGDGNETAAFSDEGLREVLDDSERIASRYGDDDESTEEVLRPYQQPKMASPALVKSFEKLSKKLLQCTGIRI